MVGFLVWLVGCMVWLGAWLVGLVGWLVRLVRLVGWLAWWVGLVDWLVWLVGNDRFPEGVLEKEIQQRVYKHGRANCSRIYPNSTRPTLRMNGLSSKL